MEAAGTFAMPWALIEVRRQWSREEETAIIDALPGAGTAGPHSLGVAC
jgi:hypothetical protein